MIPMYIALYVLLGLLVAIGCRIVWGKTVIAVLLIILIGWPMFVLTSLTMFLGKTKI